MSTLFPQKSAQTTLGLGLGLSLIEDDELGNPIISSKFNAAMLAEALCKLEGFSLIMPDALPELANAGCAVSLCREKDIPTMPAWALVGLAVVLLGGGALVFGQRRSTRVGFGG